MSLIILYPICYILIVIGVWLVTCTVIKWYLDHQAYKTMVMSKIIEWNFRKNSRGYS